MLRVAVTVEQSWHRVPGGTAWSVLELLRALKAVAGIELIGVSARHSEPPPDPWSVPIPVRSMGLSRASLYETWHLPIARFPKVEARIGGIDVVHATAIAYPATTAPVVATVHDLAFLHDPSFATRHGLRFFRRGTALARERARFVVCPSETTRRECVAAGFAPERLRVIPWGVRVAAATTADVAQAQLELGLDRPYVLFCGTVEPRKNLPALLDAFGRVAHHDALLVLAGPTGWNEDIAAARAKLGDRVRVVGFQPRDKLDALIAGAAVVAYPSRQEGFGLPVLEAMAQGAPVVTSRGTATEEVAGDAAMLVDPGDAASIAAGLDAVLSDPVLAADLRARGRARAESFTWEAAAASYAELYREARS
ncbi:MAG: glycosyltransferase family 4 protein [Acidimicrobiales bacterium]